MKREKQYKTKYQCPHLHIGEGGATIEIIVKIDEFCIQREKFTRLSIRSPNLIQKSKGLNNNKIR